MDKIIIFKGEGVWMARFQGKRARVMLAILGTDVVPTPYLVQGDAEYVRRQIAARNPGVVVTVR